MNKILIFLCVQCSLLAVNAQSSLEVKAISNFMNYPYTPSFILKQKNGSFSSMSLGGEVSCHQRLSRRYYSNVSFFYTRKNVRYASNAHAIPLKNEKFDYYKIAIGVKRISKNGKYFGIEMGSSYINKTTIFDIYNQKNGSPYLAKLDLCGGVNIGWICNRFVYEISFDRMLANLRNANRHYSKIHQSNINLKFGYHLSPLARD